MKPASTTTSTDASPRGDEASQTASVSFSVADHAYLQMVVESSDLEFYTITIALIKEDRLIEALRNTRARMTKKGQSPYVSSLAGLINTARGDFKMALLNFLYAYAYSRTPFYRHQLEDTVKKVHGENPPLVFDSLDFVSFFTRRAAKIEPVELDACARDNPPPLEGQPASAIPSALFEEVLADRGLWIAEDRGLEVIFPLTFHALMVTNDSLLIEKALEVPACGEIFEQMLTVEGTIGLYSIHMPTFTILCRKAALPRQMIAEEAIYIGGSHNMGHFILDFLPKLEVVLASAAHRDLPVYTYNLSGICRVIAETLYPEFRFIDLSATVSQHTLFSFDHVHVPSYVPAGFAFPALRRRAERFCGRTREQASPQFIYLSRGDKFRRLTNEDELIARLETLGFVVVDTMAKSFAEIVSILAAAQVVVSCIGAQCIYLVFCPQNTLYVELMPDTYVGNIVGRYNDRLYTHSRVRYRPVSSPTETEGTVGLKNEWTYRADIDAVVQLLRDSEL